MKRSILTERISRRGHHLSREYSVDPLEVILVSEVMRTSVVVLPAALQAADARQWLDGSPNLSDRRGQRLYPLVDADGRLTGVITRHELAAIAADPTLTRKPKAAPLVAYPRETLRAIAERMATRHFFVLPVVEKHSGKLLGIINAEDVLQGRARAHDRENRHQRLRMPFGVRRKPEAEPISESA